jgi:uncharacterized membrane protein (DUF373 family)
MMSREGPIEEEVLLERFTERFVRVLHWATIVIEVLVALALVALAGMALAALFTDMAAIARTGITLTPAEFNAVISTILEIFIMIELFRIAVAYMRHDHVVPTVLEAALVAVARKFVVFEGGENYLQMALGLSCLLLAVAVSWWLLTRANTLEDPTAE